MAEYIEREKAIETVKFYDGYNDPIPWAVDSLKVIPAADVVSRDCYDRLLAENDELRKARPVVHGKWRQTGGKYSRHKTIDRRILTCSVCGNVLGMEAVNCGRGDANFCPNCGARMDGDADAD